MLLAQTYLHMSTVNCHRVITIIMLPWRRDVIFSGCSDWLKGEILQSLFTIIFFSVPPLGFFPLKQNASNRRVFGNWPIYKRCPMSTLVHFS